MQEIVLPSTFLGWMDAGIYWMSNFHFPSLAAFFFKEKTQDSGTPRLVKKNHQNSPLRLVNTRWMFPKIVGFPPKSSILIGVSMIFTIHFGGPPLFFGNSQMNVNRLMGGHSPALTQSGLARRHRKRPYVKNKTSSAMTRGDRRKHSTLYTPKKKQHGQVVDLLFRDKVVQCVLVQASGNWRNYCSVLGRWRLRCGEATTSSP